MKMKIYSALESQLTTFKMNAKWLLSSEPKESVYFYTFHKCASTLFSAYILKNAAGLRHINYAKQIYMGKQPNITFKKNSYIYGPIRLSAHPASRVYKLLVRPTTTAEFIQNKTAIFFIRDPRDILVSAYYSFGFTHSLSPDPSTNKLQTDMREKVCAKSLDEYALESCDMLADSFHTLDMLIQACSKCTVIRYEDMIDDFNKFAHGLRKHISIDQKVLENIYKRTRPKEREDTSSHRRSGKPNNYQSKLKTETIDALNTKLQDILIRHQYKI